MVFRLLQLGDAGGDGPPRARGGVGAGGGSVAVVVRGGRGAPLRAELLVEPPDELVRLPVHPGAVGRRVGEARRPAPRRRNGGAARHSPVQQLRGGRRRGHGGGGGRRRARLGGAVVAEDAVVVVVVVEHLEHPRHLGRVVVAVLEVAAGGVVAMLTVAAAALADAEEAEAPASRRGGGGVAAAELDLAPPRRRGLVDREARVERAAREGPRTGGAAAAGASVGESGRGAVAAVVEGEEELAERLPRDLSAVEEEAKVHGELAARRQAPAQHVQHGAHHAPQPPRRARLRRRHHALALLLLLPARHCSSPTVSSSAPASSAST
jgi:hypothetical protein